MRYLSDKIISFSILIDGTDKRVRFSPLSRGGSIYVTGNPREIEALEQTPAYRRGLFRRAPGTEGGKDTKKEKRAKKPAPAPAAMEVAGVGSWQEAAEYLATQPGWTGAALDTPEAIRQEAAARGIRFSGLT